VAVDLRPRPVQPTHQRPLYQLHIIRRGTIIGFAAKRVKLGDERQTRKHRHSSAAASEVSSAILAGRDGGTASRRRPSGTERYRRRRAIAPPCECSRDLNTKQTHNRSSHHLSTKLDVGLKHAQNKSVLETIREARARCQVLPPSEWLNKFHRWRTHKQTNRQTEGYRQRV